MVTGATRGLGLELCRRLRALGYHVIAVVRRVPADGALTEPDSLDVVQADLSDLDAVEALAQRVAEICGGRLDVLVNNAGVGFHCRAERVIAAELSQTFHVNALAPIVLISRLLPAIRMAEGHIVN